MRTELTEHVTYADLRHEEGALNLGRKIRTEEAVWMKETLRRLQNFELDSLASMAGS
jgi:hypothetical protein